MVANNLTAYTVVETEDGTEVAREEIDGDVNVSVDTNTVFPDLESLYPNTVSMWDDEEIEEIDVEELVAELEQEEITTDKVNLCDKDELVERLENDTRVTYVEPREGFLTDDEDLWCKVNTDVNRDEVIADLTPNNWDAEKYDITDNVIEFFDKTADTEVVCNTIEEHEDVYSCYSGSTGEDIYVILNKSYMYPVEFVESILPNSWRCEKYNCDTHDTIDVYFN